MRKGIARVGWVCALVLPLLGALLWRIAGLFAPAAAAKAAGASREEAARAPASPLRGAVTWGAVPPRASRYARGADIAVPLASGPRCFARSPSGTLWVAGGAELLEMAGSGAEIRRIGLAEPATALACDADGAMFVAAGRRLEVRDAAGALRRVFADLDENALVVSIAAAPRSRDLFLADAGNKVVLHYTKEGRFLGRIGEKDDARGIPGFVVPSPCFSLAVSADRLYAANPGRHGIETYSYDGTLLGSFYKPSLGLDGFAGCCNPACIFIIGPDRILTVEKGVRRIKILSAAGDLIELVAGEEGLAAHFLGDGAIADSDGRFLVLDRASREILVFQRRDA
jgi:hypothetical protein